MKLSLILPFALLFTSSLLCLTLATHSCQSRNYEEQVRVEIKVLEQLVRRKATFSQDDKVLAFSTQNPPAWAQNATSLAIVMNDELVIGELMLDLMHGQWEYRVPAAIVGRPWSSLGDNEVILEVIGAPSEAGISGIRKNRQLARVLPPVAQE